MHEAAEVDLKEITETTDIFTQTYVIDPAEINYDKNNPAENHRDNGDSPLHGTQPSSPYLPLIYALVALYKTLLGYRVGNGKAACVESTEYHLEVRLKTADDLFFGV